MEILQWKPFRWGVKRKRGSKIERWHARSGISSPDEFHVGYGDVDSMKDRQRRMNRWKTDWH